MFVLPLGDGGLAEDGQPTLRDYNLRWAANDQQGSVREVLDQSHAILEHRDFDSYGNLTALSGAQPNLAALDTVFGFAGREIDDKTGLYYNRARWYDAKVGKFISADPIGFASGDANFYRYAGNDPVNSSDPMGLWESNLQRGSTSLDSRLGKTLTNSLGLDWGSLSFSTSSGIGAAGFDASGVVGSIAAANSERANEARSHLLSSLSFTAGTSGNIGAGSLSNHGSASYAFGMSASMLTHATENLSFELQASQMDRDWARYQRKVRSLNDNSEMQSLIAAPFYGAGRGAAVVTNYASFGWAFSERAERYQYEASVNEDALSQVGYGAGKVGVNSFYLAAGGAGVGAAARGAATTSFGRAVVASRGFNILVQGVEYAQPVMTVAGGAAAATEFHNGMVLIEQGQYQAGTESLGNAAILGTMTFALPSQRPAGLKSGNVRVFRVEGTPNTRIVIGEGGQVTIEGDTTLFLNFGNQARAEQFLSQRLGQGMPGAGVKSFEVPQSVLSELRASAVPQSMARQFPNRPIVVDTTKAPDQFGLRPEQTKSLQQRIVPGSGKKGF